MKNGLKRVMSLLLAFAMVVGYIPVTASAAEAAGIITTVADPQTLTRPQTIYGNNTENAGKITVGKSVSTAKDGVDLGGRVFDEDDAEDTNNFFVTISQSAQVAGLSSEMSVPVDVVFVLDTSNSMTTDDRIGATISAANAAIKSLLTANDYNRVAVVAFSGTSGQGSAPGQSATILTQLGHYDAVDNHIYSVNNKGNASGSGSYIRGQGANSGWRQRTSQGTNIHAGVAMGGNILASVEDTTVTLPDGQVVTRMPFLVVMSDGAASLGAANGDNNGYWFKPSNTATIGSVQEVDGLNFLATLTAAYYKGLITENYYGTKASADNRCYVYTMGLGLSSGSLAEVTMNPSKNYTNNNSYKTFESYWDKYEAGNTFSVKINNNWNNNTHEVPADSITATKKYVYGTGLGYSGSFRYNDAYFSASQSSQMAAAFDDVIKEISQKVISSPTKVTTTPEFSGYVTFTDPIGEYMEVKDVEGFYANGVLYSGGKAEDYLSHPGSNSTFDTTLREVLKTRLTMTASQDMEELVSSMITGRANSENITDNSITWWGKVTDTNDVSQVQCLGYADNDTIEYITKPTTQIPASADVLCRSYFFYGETEKDHEYMYFMVRVQRELTAPYKETVVISIPSSLLSVESVMITEESNGGYTAKVTKAEPARVVYEVGLRSDINSYNVESIVSAEYKTANGYNFYTNEWDRNADEDHHKALAKATFDAAQDNPFYAYQEDTQIYVKNGSSYVPYTGNDRPAGKNYAYKRTYYQWENKDNKSGSFAAEEKTAFIPIEIPAAVSENVFQSNGNWYIKKGLYTASSLQVNGDDTVKTSNLTGTAGIVAHPHRTNSSDSQYTVLLGNNGKLSIKAQEFRKNVDVNPETTRVYTDNGKAVTIGDILEYQIVLPNEGTSSVTMTVIDTIPAGTEFVTDSASDGGSYADGKITWTDVSVPKNGKNLTFQVRVTDAVYKGTVPVVSIDNQAHIAVGGNEYSTNVTHNPPEHKEVQTSADAADGTHGTLKVGDTLTYTINWHNDSGADATVIVKDKVPAGTTLVNPELYSVDTDGNLIWTMTGVPANATGTVDFTVYVDASAKVNPGAEAQPESGEIDIANTEAQIGIKIGENDPIFRSVNDTHNKAGVGNITLSKTLKEPENANDQNAAAGKTFTLNLSEQSGKLNGTYSGVKFTNGKATVKLTAGGSITIKGLPQGITILVSEDLSGMPGWTPSYAPATQSIVVAQADANVTIKIENDYTPTPVSFQLKGSKTFSGPFPAGKYTFAFTAQQQTVTESGNVPTDVTPMGTPFATARVTYETTDPTDTKYTYAFDAVTFTSVTTGSLYYLIKEVYSNHAGVITDTDEYLLKLEIVNDLTTGALKALTHWSKNSGTGWSEWKPFSWETDSTTFSFENIYPAPTSITINGTKSLSGRNINADDSFLFELLAADGTTVLANTGVTGADGTSNEASFLFNRYYAVTDLDNGKDDTTFTYFIKERAMNAEGMTYDTTTYKVKVTVGIVDNNVAVKAVEINDGAASVTKNSNGTYATSIPGKAFTNTFKPKDISLSLATTKTLTGILTDEVFSFSVYQTDSDFVIDSEAKLVGGGNTAVTALDTATNVNLGSISYVPSNMNKDGEGNYIATTFYYVVKENIPAPGSLLNYDYGMTYDDTVYNVAVKVNIDSDHQLYVESVSYDNNSGTLVTAVKDEKGHIISATVNGFTNNRVDDKETIKPMAYKTTVPTTGNILPADLRFSFVVRPATIDAYGVITYNPSSVVTTGLSDPTTAGTDGGANKPVSTFGTITYTAAQLGAASSMDFYYVIEESNASAHNGIQYDSSKYVLRVTLAREAIGKPLTVTEQYFKLNADNTLIAINDEDKYDSKPLFKNVYDANASIALTAAKKLSGRPMNADEFDFRLQRLTKNGDVFSVGNSSAAVDGTNAAAADGVEGEITFASLYFKLKTDAQDGNITPDDLVEGKTNEYKAYYLMSEIPGTAVAGVTSGGEKYIVTIKLTHGSSLTAELDAVNKATVENGAYKIGDSVTLDNSDPHNTQATFSNSYTAAGTDVTITANKVLTGRALRDGEFTFNLYREGVDGVLATAANAADGTVTFKRTYSQTILPSSAFGSDNTYTIVYRLEEAPVTTGGVTGDTNKYWVKVVITHNVENGTYTASTPEYYSDYDAENKVVKGDPISVITYHNQYKTTGTTFKPVVNKVMLNAVDKTNLPIPEQKFNFNVYEMTKSGDTYTQGNLVGSGSTMTSTAENPVSVIDFTPIAINGHSGNRYYLIEEIVGTDATVTYSAAKVLITVPVKEDQTTGVLAVDMDKVSYEPYGTEPDYDSVNKQFVNYKAPGNVSVKLDVQKTVKIYEGTILTDRTYPLADSEFNFYVTETNDRNASAIADGTNSADGKVIFDDIVITLDAFDAAAKDSAGAATFTYFIWERAKSGNDKLVTDGNSITATVTVTKDEHKNLSYTVVYAKSGKVIDEADKVFVNKYTHDPITVSLTGTKTLIGKDLAKDEFSFQLYDSADNLVKTVTNGVEKPDTADSEKKILYVNEIDFGTLNFNAPGTYTYYVKEVKKEAATTDPGTYGYDEKTIYVEVNVIETLGTQGMSATVSYYTKDAEGNKVPYSGIAFTNTYSPKAVMLDVPITVSKSIVDENGNEIAMPKDGFQFELVGLLDKDGKPVTMTAKTGEKEEWGANMAKFENVVFTEPGPFTFTILESAKQSADKQGYTIDPTLWVVNVVVSYNATAAEVPYVNVKGENKMAAPGELYIENTNVHIQKVELSAQDLEEAPGLTEATSGLNAYFTNIYAPKSGPFQITLHKELVGRDLKAGEYTFRLVSGEIIAAQATNDVNGNIVFHLAYTAKDMAGAEVVGSYLTKTFNYVAKEVIPAEKDQQPGVTYSDKKIPVSVTVQDVNGELKVTGVNVPSDATFTNSYEPEPDFALISASKVITGWDLAGNSFKFELMDANGKTLQSVRNDRTGKVNFEPIKYTEAGTYRYTIVEIDEGIEHMTYDGSEIDVTVVVTDDLNGKLVASEPHYSEAPIFLNVYDGNDARVAIQANKTLKGRVLKADEFTFQLVDEANSVVAEAKNDAEGKINFPAMFYPAVGTHVYTIREVKGTEPGMTYDETLYKVTVTVTQTADGSYQADVVYDTADSKVPTFVNRFNQSIITLQAKKTLEGRVLKSDEFRFQLLDKNGNVLQTKNNDADGNITFDAITLLTSGSYTYTIQEIPGNEAGMTYDDSKVTVTVKVNENASGTFDTEIAYKGGKIPTFVNKYDLASVTLQAKKTLAGRTLKNGEFSFLLLDKDGKVLQTKTNDAAGNISFDAINLYTKGTYKYTIQEVTGSEAGMTYDSSKISVTVKVKENREGRLEAVVTYDTADGALPTFVNKYEPAPAKVTVTAAKKLTGRNLIAGEFTFWLMDGKNVVAETRNAADGTVAFDLTYTDKDLNGGTEKKYEYTIVEVIPEEDKAIPGVTYDASSAKVSVTITDNGGQIEVNGKSEAVIASGKTFTNTYTADSAPVIIMATKKLEGWNLTDSGAAFRFLLTPVDAEGKVIEGGNTLHASNDAQGNIAFPEIVYQLSDLDGKEEKTFYYQISEEAGTVSGMTYDKSLFTVAVTVTNDGKGYLSTDVQYSADPVFVNSYKGTAAPVTIRAKKILDTKANRKLKAGEFTFELLDSKGKVISQATNDANGNVSFETFTVAETGTYSYTIQEVAGKEAGMRYDKSKEKVSVEVTQTVDGSYKATVTYDTKDGAEPLFINEYDAQPVKITLTGTKKLYGRSLRRGEFKFQIRDSKGNLIADGQNDKNGNIVFDEMEFATPGTYVLKISEVKGKTRYMTYDSSVFSVTVTVTEENGVLSASAVAAKEVLFQNYYTPPYSNPKTGDEMPLMPMVLMMLSSAVALTAVLVLYKKRRNS